MNEQQFIDKITEIGKALNSLRDGIIRTAKFSIVMFWIASLLIVLTLFFPQLLIATNIASGICVALAGYYGILNDTRTNFEKDMAWFQMMYHAYKDCKDPEEKKHLINSTIPLLEKMEEWL